MSTAAPPPLILCVEDEGALRHDIVEELEEAGYRVLEAADGDRALRLLQDTSPDLVLCDISMAGLDGYGLLRAMRTQRPDLADVPFVFLTALAEPRDVVEGKRAGADDYLVKPIDYDLMLATIAARLRQVARIRNRHETSLSALQTAVSGLSGRGAEQALDLVAEGIVLLDGDGRLLHANRAAREMATGAHGLCLGPDGIDTADVLSGRALTRAIAETLEAAKADRDAVAGVQLAPPGDGTGLSAVVCALPARAAPIGAPAVAVFLSAKDRGGRVSDGVLMDLFDLTPTEALVARALAEGGRPADIALQLRVSQTTIAFHMRNLFQKTRTNRQAELVALILASPVVMTPR